MCHTWSETQSQVLLIQGSNITRLIREFYELLNSILLKDKHKKEHIIKLEYPIIFINMLGNILIIILGVIAYSKFVCLLHFSLVRKPAIGTDTI